MREPRFKITLPTVEFLSAEEIAAIKANPEFVAILAKNIDFYLKNGHDSDPLPKK